jgi:hypothetical protein
MREPTLIAATIGTAVAALRFQDEFRPDRYDHIGCCHKLAFHCPGRRLRYNTSTD